MTYSRSDRARTFRAVTVLATFGAFAALAQANVLSGRVSGNEMWTVSPGGAACPWSWAADWDLNLVSSTMTVRQTVRVQPGVGQTGATSAELTDWETRIERAWNNGAMYVQCVDLFGGFGQTYQIRYDITLVTPGFTGGIDSSIDLFDGSGGTNASQWFRTGGSGVNRMDINVAAHEVGHLLGNADEYTDGGCIVTGAAFNGPAFTTTSLMNNTNATIAGTPVGRTLPRHFRAWEIAFNQFNLGKGQTNNYFVIPAPAGGMVLAVGVAVIARRRRLAA